MFEKLSRYILGHMRVDITGRDKARFLNLAVRRGIGFWEYGGSPQREHCSVRAAIFRRAQLQQLADKLGTELAFSDQRGLPLLLRRLKKRPGLLLGAVAALCLIVELSGRIWVLNVAPSEHYSRQEILEAAEELGIFVGAAYEDFDPVAAGRLMLLALPEISWVSINNDGVVAEIALTDRRMPPKMEEKQEGIFNVVAGKTGIITMVEAYEGMPVVAAGDVVKEGEMCISGIWEDKYGRTLTGASRGRVMARVQEKFSLSIPMERTLVTRGEGHLKRSLQLFTLRLPLSFSSHSFEDFETRSTRKALKLLGMELPVAYVEEESICLQRQREVMSRQQAEEKALEELEKLMGEYSREGAELLWQETELSFGRDSCRAESLCCFLEDIALQQEVLVDERILS